MLTFYTISRLAMLNSFAEQVERARRRQAQRNAVLALSQPREFMNALANQRFKLISDFVKENESGSISTDFTKIVNWQPNTLVDHLVFHVKTSAIRNRFFLEVLSSILKHLKPNHAFRIQLFELHRMVREARNQLLTKTQFVIEQVQQRIAIAKQVGHLVKEKISTRRSLVSSFSPEVKQSESLAKFVTLRGKAKENKKMWEEHLEFLKKNDESENQKNPDQQASMLLLNACPGYIKNMLGNNCCEEQVELNRKFRTLKMMR
jgi:hypothetical protein